MGDPQAALTFSYHKQLIDKMRIQQYNMELKQQLLIKMLEERKILADNELDRRWPQYLISDIGALGPEGKMEGVLKVTFFGDVK